MTGPEALAHLRASASIGRHATFKVEQRVTAGGFVQIAKPVSRRAAKSVGSRTLTLKVKNWQIKAAHFN